MDITELDISTWVEKEELADHMAKLAANAEEFLASIGKAPLEVYRIEQFKPTLQPVDTHGRFFVGDSYVVVKQFEEEYKIHYWHGNECTTDEMGSSAAFSVQISATLPKESSHCLELQGHETEDFESYFRGGIEYLPGGVESGFKMVEPKEFKTRLLHVKGKKSARILKSHSLLQASTRATSSSSRPTTRSSSGLATSAMSPREAKLSTTLKA